MDPISKRSVEGIMFKMSQLPSSTPDPLLHMCVRYCANNIEILARSALINPTDEAKAECHTVQNTSGMPNFPKKLSNMIFAYIGRYRKTQNRAEFVQLMSLFSDPNKTPLSQLSLQQEHSLSTSLPWTIFNQPIQYMDLCCCQFHHYYNNAKSVSVFDKMFDSLTVLRLSFYPLCRTSGHRIDKSDNLADRSENFTQSREDGDTTNNYVSTAANKQDVPKFPALTHFILNVDEEQPIDPENVRWFFSKVISTSFTYLTHLQFLGLGVTEDELGFLDSVPNLTSLGLSGHRITNIGFGLRQIAKAKNLSHLDLSITEPRWYNAPEESIGELLDSLPSLTSLDISGTNLAGSNVEHPHRDQANNARDEKTINGSFGCRKFSFLGLCNCNELPFTWENVPAEQFTCFDRLDNLVLALDVYKDNQGMVFSVLESLSSFISKAACGRHMTKMKVALDKKTRVMIENLLRIIHLHPSIEPVQTKSCTCIAQLMERNMPSIISIRATLGQSLCSRLLETTIYLMNNYLRKVTEMECMDILSKLKLPHDANYCYSMERYTKSMLDRFCDHKSTKYVDNSLETSTLRQMRIAIDYGDHDFREFLGQRGFIEFLLSVARRKKTGIISLAWRCLWGITDEEPGNCARFVAVPDAVQLFLECIKDKIKDFHLVRSLLGVMVNVSMVHELRKKLLPNEELIVFLRDLLDSKSMETVVTYEAACVCAFLVMDGPDAWVLDNVDRSSVLCKIATAVRRWGIMIDMETVYRTLEPFLKLAQTSTVPEAQLLGIWCICNLVVTEGKLYSPMLKMEGGLPVLEAIKIDPKTTSEVLEFTVMTMRAADKKDIPEMLYGSTP